MLVPSIIGESLFDDLMDSIDDFDREFFPRADRTNHAKVPQMLMRTDVKETDDSYELDVDLPGFAKENVTAQLENGYLTIQASTNTNNDEKDKEGKYIRRERFSGRCSRSFYVGEEVKQEEIKAKFENGILKLSVPKKDAKKVEDNKFISIEG